MKLIAALITGSGILLLLLSLPLIYRRVPRNAIYGVRIPASFRSEAEWYRINAMGGRYLAVAGGIIAVTGLAGFFLPLSALVPWSCTAAVISLLSVTLPCIRLCLIRMDSDHGA